MASLTIEGVNGINQKIVLRQVKGSSTEINLGGGQVISWKNDNGEELLFISSEANNKANCGGIPICFPQCGNHGSLEAHGFGRYRIWSADPNPPPPPPDNTAYVDLILTPSEDDLDIKIWPHSFEFRLRVSLGPEGNLKMKSRVRNTDTKPFNFTFAYHTYLRVSDISDVRVEGLETTNYIDNTKNKELCTERADALTFDEEVDKVYLSTPNKISIWDHGLKKRIYVMHKYGLPDTVVWNLGEKKAKALLADFGDKDYQNMLCVAPAALEKPIVLNPGEEWTGMQELSVVGSYNDPLHDDF